MGSASERTLGPASGNIPGLNITRQEMADIYKKADEYEKKNGEPQPVDYRYPFLLPGDWQKIDSGIYGARYVSKGGLRVIMSASVQEDGKPWLHVSFSRQNRLPTHDDLLEVKRLFIGKDRTAYQVFPDEAHYVNINPFVLHLWCCLDGPVTPDFTRGLGTI